MSLSIETKKAVVEEIVAGIGNAQTMVLAEYRGISVASMTELRANARKEGVYLRVLKNTLARRAVEGTSFAGLAEHMVGPLVYAASEDAVAAAKVLHQFRVVKNCCLNCCSSCRLRCLAWLAVWLLWLRKKLLKKHLLNHFLYFTYLFN